MNADNNNYVLMAKIKGLSDCYSGPPCVAFAFLLTPDCWRAISSTLFCLLSAVQFTHHFPDVSVVCTWSGALTRTTSVQHLQKNIDSSSKSNPLRCR